MTLNHLKVNYHFVTYSCMISVTPEAQIHLCLGIDIDTEQKKRRSQYTSPKIDIFGGGSGFEPEKAICKITTQPLGNAAINPNSEV